MIVDWAFVVAGFILIYACWRVSIVTWGRLNELGISHNRSSTTYFDNILNSGLVALLFSRLTWMLLNVQVYADVPWGILPYSRSASGITWFTLFPWRFLRIQEGVLLPLFWGIMAFGVISTIFVPTIKLAMRLRLEKRGVMRSFVIKAVLSIVAILGYFGTLIYYSL